MIRNKNDYYSKDDDNDKNYDAGKDNKNYDRNMIMIIRMMTTTRIMTTRIMTTRMIKPATQIMITKIMIAMIMVLPLMLTTSESTITRMMTIGDHDSGAEILDCCPSQKCRSLMTLTGQKGQQYTVEDFSYSFDINHLCLMFREAEPFHFRCVTISIDSVKIQNFFFSNCYLSLFRYC
jgi:hypothetical protein